MDTVIESRKKMIHKKKIEVENLVAQSFFNSIFLLIRKIQAYLLSMAS